MLGSWETRRRFQKDNSKIVSSTLLFGAKSTDTGNSGAEIKLIAVTTRRSWRAAATDVRHVLEMLSARLPDRKLVKLNQEKKDNRIEFQEKEIVSKC